MEESLTAGYFDLLGTLSKYPEGIEYVSFINPISLFLMVCVSLMERFRFFTLFYHISELRSREDLVKGIIENIDYTM